MFQQRHSGQKVFVVLHQGLSIFRSQQITRLFVGLPFRHTIIFELVHFLIVSIIIQVIDIVDEILKGLIIILLM